MASEVPIEPSLQAKIAALKSAQTYDDTPSVVEAIETHFAWVFLAGEHAYKLKKPVQTHFSAAKADSSDGPPRGE